MEDTDKTAVEGIVFIGVVHHILRINFAAVYQALNIRAKLSKLIQRGSRLQIIGFQNVKAIGKRGKALCACEIIRIVIAIKEVIACTVFIRDISLTAVGGFHIFRIIGHVIFVFPYI